MADSSAQTNTGPGPSRPSTKRAPLHSRPTQPPKAKPTYKNPPQTVNMTAYLHVHGIAPNFVPSLDHIGDIRAVGGEIQVDDVYNNEFVVVPDWRNFRVMGVERREPGEVKITYVTQGTAQYIGWNERDVGSGENADN